MSTECLHQTSSTTAAALPESNGEPSDRALISPGDLAELIACFSEVTTRLEATHDQLRGEVGRLNAELSRANEQLERSRRLAALGEMAAGIAHEVRNPLGSIRLYARMLDQDLADRPSERQTVRKIDTAACGLDAIVGDVLTFSREFSLRTAPCDAVDLITQSLEACCHDGVRGWRAAEIVRADILRTSRGATTVSEFHADRSLVQQALVNVIRNGFEAIDEAAARQPGFEHRLVIDTLARECSDAQGNLQRFHVLSVRDTGPGVSADVVARMFNPFFTTRSTGTGLGLAIVHRIVDAHGGRVAVIDNASVEGAHDDDRRGTTVELLFPAHHPATEFSQAA